jgi:hypothetical protein
MLSPPPSTENMCKEALERGDSSRDELVTSEGRSHDERSEIFQESFLTGIKSTPSSSQDGLLVNRVIFPYDVLCGRCKDAFNNIGNRRFRVTVSLWLSRYVNAPTRQDKSLIINAIRELVRETGGRFLKHRNGGFGELSDKEIREKVGHALRDMVTARDMAVSKDDLDTVGTAAARKEGSLGSRSKNENKATLCAMARKSYRTCSSGHNEQHHTQESNTPFSIPPESGIERYRRLSSVSPDSEIDQVFALREPPDRSTSGNSDEGESSKASSALGMLDDSQQDDDGQMDSCWEANVAPEDIDDLVNSCGFHSVCRGILDSTHQDNDTWIDWDYRGILDSTHQDNDIWIDWDYNVASEGVDAKSTALDRIPSVETGIEG